MNVSSSIPAIFPVVSGASPTVSSTVSSAEDAAPETGFADNQDKDARSNPQGLDEAQLKQLAELKARDREVRAHEAAHQAVGGQYAGAMSFTFQRGPDGAQYAVGGEVPIDVAPVAGDPQATIEKMRIVRAAAMAPAQPSAQDRAVAAQAMQTMLQAQSELAAGDDNEQSDSPAAGSDPVGQTASGRQASELYQSVFAMQNDASGAITSVFA
ncbi:putative metalloprotease CJM1_0395 family protein [Marinobacter sp.]|uniref:putative metalloprotease CJM1_0395 family protein n=1 Tax=Marinobacter sp. TaxID=50741 RepID=UPI0019E86927|nr:putative metalloprotease CJM1_0395 family protein [Marinobacter sp.]MBE0485532.1 hypothetical protein [Marinobacter sp.]